MKDSIIEFHNIAKQFSGNYALKGVSFSIKSGEVHALLGENGAGKSTLLNILHGVYTEYEGNFSVEGNIQNFKNTNDAFVSGIAKVHQEVTVVEDLTAGQNIALGNEPKNRLGFIDFPTMYTKTDAILDRLGCSFKSTTVANQLSVGDKQMILIAKALYHEAKIISFDEPTTALTDREVIKLFQIIQDLKKEGITILYVTHRMKEVEEIVDRATILRDGQYIATKEIATTSSAELIKNMVGRDVEAFATRTKLNLVQESEALSVKNLCGEHFSNISFTLHKGEILSFAGLVGAGRTEIMRVIFGADPCLGGEVYINGKEACIKSPSQAMNSGIALIPENRKTQGFIPVLNNGMNIAIASLSNFTKNGFISYEKLYSQIEKSVKQLHIQPKDPHYMTENLSGGNQQKVIVAKWLLTDSDIIIFDEPTKGIDVGAKAEIYALMENLASQGKAILMVSSELPEVIGLSDRVIVIREGQLVKTLLRDELSEEIILHYAMEG